MKLSSGINEFLKQCKDCGRCKRLCPFLDMYGSPAGIIIEKPEKAFLCSNCKACDSVCKENLHPSEALFEMKSILLKNGSIPVEVKNALQSSRSFALRGHRFPFAFYPSVDVAFWPGCGLAGTSPETVKKTVQLLINQLNKKVGLIMDCCFDPLYQLGDVDSVREASERICNKLKKHKITHVITGCTNCRKTLSQYLIDIKVEHIFEVLSEKTIRPLLSGTAENHSSIVSAKGNGGGLYLHHPCPSFHFGEIRAFAKTFLQPTDNDNSRPACCGHGGGISSLSPTLSEKFTDNVVRASKGDSVVTYCMGCKSKFLQKGQKAYHVLELMTGVKAIEEPVSPRKKWVNRFFLAFGQKFNFKKLLLGSIVILLILLTAYLRREGYISTEGILNFLKQHKVAAPLFFILIYAMGPSLFIPSLPLTLGAGFLWGPFWGVVFSITGATSGASIAFLVSRYLIGNTVKERFGYERWDWIKDKVERHGWKAVAFSRIVPIFPFPVLNYLFGITPIPFLHYLWSTFVFMLPACIAYVAFGSSMGELILRGNIGGLIIGIIIASIAMLLPFALKPIVEKVFPQKDSQG